MNAPRHVYPTSVDLPDIGHAPDAKLTRSRPEPGCALCAAGRCWQEVRVERGGELVVHGTVLA